MIEPPFYPLNRGTMDVLHLDHDTMNSPPAVARKKAGILDSGLVDYEMVAGVRFELTTFGLCDLTQLSLRVGLYLHPV
jgi:hypothetical protein